MQGTWAQPRRFEFPSHKRIACPSVKHPRVNHTAPLSWYPLHAKSPSLPPRLGHVHGADAALPQLGQPPPPPLPGQGPRIQVASVRLVERSKTNTDPALLLSSSHPTPSAPLHHHRAIIENSGFHRLPFSSLRQADTSLDRPPLHLSTSLAEPFQPCFTSLVLGHSSGAILPQRAAAKLRIESRTAITQGHWDSKCEDSYSLARTRSNRAAKSPAAAQSRYPSHLQAPTSTLERSYTRTTNDRRPLERWRLFSAPGMTCSPLLPLPSALCPPRHTLDHDSASQSWDLIRSCRQSMRWCAARRPVIRHQQ